MPKTKIPWCDETWNPVWGCYNDCQYCYAKKIAKRFGKTEQERDFLPMWKESNFNKQFAKSTKRVFVNSMSDITWWNFDWRKKVAKKIQEYPDIDFIFLTKNRRYREYNLFYNIYHLENVIYGLTVTSPEDLLNFEDARFPERYRWLLNIEPILGDFNIFYHVNENTIKKFDWIILGAETGNRKDKVIPELSWYRHFLDQHDVPVFLKPSLDKYTPPELIRREFIK